MALAAGDDARTFGEGVFDMRFDLEHGGFVDQRALRDAIAGTVTDLELFDGDAQFLGECVVDFIVHVEAIRADAGLAAVAIFRCDGAGDGRIQIRVFEDDERCVTAEFERHFLDRRRALRHEQAAHGRRAGEGQFAHDRVARHFRADGFRLAGDDVEHAARHTGAFGQYGEGECRQRRGFGRFDDDRAAGGEGGADFTGDHGGREIPRRDGCADTDWFFRHDDAFVACRRGDGVAVDAFAFFGEPFQERGGVEDFAFGFGEGFALFGGEDLGQIVGVFQHEVMPFAEDRGAVFGGGGSPCGPCGVGCVDGSTCFGCAHAGHCGDGFACGGVFDVECGVVVGGLPFACYVGFCF